MAETPWGDLAPDTGRRVDGHGRHDIFWARMPDGAPGLVLRLGEGVAEVHPLPQLRNLTLCYRTVEGRGNLCLSLSDHGQADIFDTLCRDVVSAAESVESPNAALARAVQRTLRWHHLLRSGGTGGLTLEEQRGLVAELAVLRALIESFGAFAAVEAWKGPEGSAKDFELATMHVEVKARRGAAHPKIAISSEVQLETIDGFALYLRVIDVDTAIAPEGLSLADHVGMTGAMLASDPAAVDLWERRIAATGFRPEDVDERRVWKTGTSRTYEVRDGFPRMTPPLPLGVENLKYYINLHACAPFEVYDDVLSPARIA
ncbi:PD-(D/E)XK motif protein [Paracoccus sp. Ld10]|uniref:PD-(D/E)XK motif protein n=1 Tax=Paracoccus sp. Ld10 TaxID=649158 RepID=UPI00386BF13E